MNLVDRWDFLGDLANAWEDARKTLAASLRTASRVVDRIKTEVERWLDFVSLGDDGLITLHGLVSVLSDGRVGIGTSAPATSAAVEISSTTGALLLPRLTTAQRDALTAVDGMTYYNSDTAKAQIRAGGAWVDLH